MPLSTGERLGPVQGIGWVPGIRRQWRDDGKQIVYVDLKGVLWAVDLDTGSTIQARTPRQLFQISAGSNAPAVSADLKRFLIPVPVEQKVPQAFTMKLNWTSALKTR